MSKKKADFHLLEGIYIKRVIAAMFYEFFLFASVIWMLVVEIKENYAIWTRCLQMIVLSRWLLLLFHLFRKEKNVYALCPCALDSRPLSKLSFYTELGLWYFVGISWTLCISWWVLIADVIYFVVSEEVRSDPVYFSLVVVFDVVVFLEFFVTKYIVWRSGIVNPVSKMFGKKPLNK